MKIQIAALTIFILALGCGKKADDETVPLNATRKQALADTISSIGMALTAVQVATGQQGGSSKPVQDMANALKGNCELGWKNPDPVDPSSNYATQRSAKAIGSNCPVDFSLSMKWTKDLQKEESVVNARYSVKHHSFAGHNDVSAFEYLASGHVVAPASGASVRGEFKGNGKIRSFSQGDVVIKVEGATASQSNQSDFLVQKSVMYRFEFAKFVAVVKSVNTRSNSGKRNEYYLNGEAISLEEYKSLLVGAGPLFQESP